MSGLVKPEFASPTGLTPETVGSNIASANVIDNLITRWWINFLIFILCKWNNFIPSRHSFPDDVSKKLSEVQKEEHNKRMKNLRKELEYIDKTNWQFEPIEKLLGQT